jgi:hypothetical protein
MSVAEAFFTITIGGLLFLYGMSLWRKRERLLRSGQLTTGIITGHDEGPIVEFRAKNDQLIRVKPPAYPSRRYRSNGSQVSVYYNPANPNDFLIHTFEHKIVILILTVGGVVFFVGGIFSLS